MTKKNLTIGLFGFGCVGYGLHEVLQRTPTLERRFSSPSNNNFAIARVEQQQQQQQQQQ